MCGYHSASASYSASCSSCSSYSPLEKAVSSYSSASSSYSSSPQMQDLSYMISASPNNTNIGRIYDSKETGKSMQYNNKDNYHNLSSPITRTYSHIPDDFLNPNRRMSVFIGSASEIKELVEEAFIATTGMPFPDDIQVHILEKKEIAKLHTNLGGMWDNGIQGFAINRKNQGMISEIFIKKEQLDKIMITLGHELGHVLTRKLDNAVDEEAKAFAFSIEWLRKIKELNIGNLSTAIQLDKPAANGLHNIALDFVFRLLREGKEALDIYKSLCMRLLSVKENV